MKKILLKDVKPGMASIGNRGFNDLYPLIMVVGVNELSDVTPPVPREGYRLIELCIMKVWGPNNVRFETCMYKSNDAFFEERIEHFLHER